MNRKLVMYDDTLFFLDDAGKLMKVVAEMDGDDFFHFKPTSAKETLPGAEWSVAEIQGIKDKLL